MPGTLLTDDAEQMYADRLAQHAQSVWDTIQQAPQQVADAAQPALQAVSGATQGWQPIVPSIPMPQAPQVPTPQMPQIDPQAVADAQQALLQHAQGVWSQVQQAPQQVQQAAPDPSAVADATDRLQQHATNTWQTIGQGLSGATPAPVQQATNPTAPDQTTTPEASPAQSSSTDQTGTNAPAPDRSMSFQDYAKAAAQRAGIDPNVFTAQIQQESGFNPSARSPAGAIGIAQFTPATAAGVNLDPTDPYASLDAAAAEDAKRLQQYQGDWGKTLASYNAGAGAVAQYGGIPPYKETQSYVSTIMGNAQKAADAAGTTISGAVQAGQQAVSNAASSATQNVQQAASNVLPAISQFGDKQLTAAEAYAACGPAAAVRFAQLYGRNPTLREATDLASSVGWTADTGMAGLQSESKLFDSMQIPHRVVSADWNALAKDAQSGNPVTISTPGHYFTADNYNPSTGAFHVGSSGTDLRQGSEWMTPQQMESVMGPLQGGLVADNPNTPGTSPISAPATAAGNAASAVGTAASTAVTAAQQGWNAITPGLQSLDSAVQDAASTAGQAVGGAASAVGTTAQNVAQGAQQAVNAAGQTITDLGTNAGQAAGGAIDTARTGVQQAADTAGRGLPDITGTLTPDAVPGGASSPLGKIAQGQQVSAPEQLEAAGQTALGYEQSRSQAAADIDPLRQLPGGNIIGPTVEQLTDPATWVGVGGVKSAIGVAASVAASVAAQQVAQNVIPDDDPNKGVKVALVSLLGAFTGGPVGERTIAPLVDRADTLVQSLGVDGVSNLVKQATDAAGDKVAPAVKQFANEELGTVGAPADVADAVSGTQAGQVAAPFAARLGGAAAGGAVGYQTTPDDASPQERALRTGAGAVAGYAGVAAASKVASALSDILKPDLPAAQLEQAIKTVNETQATAPEIIDQVQKMPGTAELAPVRQQVPQSSTDLLQAMLDAARAKGADPDKLAALEQQISAMDPAAATRRGLGDFLSSESGTLTLPPGTVRAVGRAAQAARIGALAGGVQTLGHIALNTPVQIGLKMASDLGANLRYPEANAAEAYGAMQGLRHWGMNAASTLAKPGPLASSMGGGAGAQALETGLTGLVKAHPLLQDIPRQMATQMELYRTAAQAATDAGLPRLGAAWRAEVARLVASPTADMTSAAKSAGDTAALAGPMGTTGQAFSELIKKSPAARFAVPIFDIGYRVASQGVEMTPLGTAGILADVGRAAIGEGPYAGAKGFAGRGASDAVTPLAQRVRNNVIGLALMYEGYQQAAQGNLTGEGPSDPGKQAALRQTGWQSDSVKIGGRYFNAHLLGPLGWPLIAGANTFESMNGPGGQGLTPIKTPEGERAPGALDMLGDYVARQGRYFNNETFLNQLGSVLNLVGSGIQQGQVPANEAANVLQSLIPQGALLANLASSQDPYQRNPKAGATPIEDIQNQIASRLPDNPWTPSRSQLQPRLTATGTPMPNPQQGLGVVLPRSSVGNPDPILDEMQHTGVVPTNVPTTVPYGPTGEVQMTPGEQYTWQQYRGSALQQLAGDLINSPGYKNADLTTQRNLLARVNSAASAEASRFIERDIVTSPGGALTRRMSTGKQAPVQSYEPAG